MNRRFALIALLAIVVSACVEGEANTTTTAQVTTFPTATRAATQPTLAESLEIPPQLSSMAQIWETDFSNTIIDLDELLVGISASDPRDMIRPIDAPVFDDVATSDWLADQEPGVLIDIDGDSRFYPLSVLTRHEIVNDEVGGVPVAVTYCPLCNTAVVFDRRFDGEVLRLGVSGLLRNSDLVMWDDVTETLWQQITGQAIVGEHAGASLTRLGSAIVRWADFRSRHPEGLTLGPDQGYGNVYGHNPYALYSSRSIPYGFYTGEVDPRYPAMERVVGVELEEVNRAYPFSLISEVRVANDVVAGTPVAIFWGAPDTADALDGAIIAQSRGIGTGVAYSPVVDGRTLTFTPGGDGWFTDDETGSTWTLLGLATSGPLEGTELVLIPHTNEFWFVWQAFFPDGEVWDG